MDHDADGIRELDNKLPRWWVWLFNLCNLFALVYMLYYHVFRAGDLMAAEYQREMVVGDAVKSKTLAKFESEMASLEPSKDPVVISEGKNVYDLMCAPCHRPDAGGLVGPNLTDDFWIHGKEFKDNLRTIYNGVPEKGMVTWKGVLKPNQIHAVGSYIYTLRGTQPPNPKPPESQQAAPAANLYE